MLVPSVIARFTVLAIGLIWTKAARFADIERFIPVRCVMKDVQATIFAPARTSDVWSKRSHESFRGSIMVCGHKSRQFFLLSVRLIIGRAESCGHNVRHIDISLFVRHSSDIEASMDMAEIRAK